MGSRLELFRLLQGLISVYKSPGLDIKTLKRRIGKKLANEFNKLPWDSGRIRTEIVANNCNSAIACISCSPDIANNPLVIGQQFESTDFVLNVVDPLPEFVSGVQVIGIGEKGAYDYVDALHKARLFKYYHLTGMLGQLSSNGLGTGSIISRTSWRHVTRMKLSRVLLSIEFKARSASLLQAGILPNTQKAFEALSDERRAYTPLKPMIEPLESLPPDQVTPYWDRYLEHAQNHSLRATPDPSSVPQLPTYLNTIRCIEFKPPFFTLEIQVANETDQFFVDLMVNIGALLRSSCLLSKARRVRHGPFSAMDSLLMKECVVPLEIHDRLEQLRSEPPVDDFESEDEYRRHMLSKLVGTSFRFGSQNILTNLLRCSYDNIHQSPLLSGTQQPTELLE